MNRYPWYRMYAEARTDAKLRTLTDAQFRVWFNLLCYASEQDERGTIPPTDPFLLAVEVASGDEALLSGTLERLIALRMIELGDDTDTLTFRKFTERQYDKPSDAPDATRGRKARQREKERDSRVTQNESRPMSRDVTPSHAPEESKEEESKEEERIVEESIPPVPPAPKQRAKGATPAPDSFPISDLMREWAAEAAPGVDVDRQTMRFLNRNRAEGKLYKDWHAAWRNWITSDYSQPKARAPTGPVMLPNGREVDASTARKLNLVASLKLGG